MSEYNISLINFDGLGEIAVALIEKISSAIGWVVTRETPKRVAIQSFVESIKESDMDPITKAALISQANAIIKGYCNQGIILQNAINNLHDTARPKDVDNDWISQFMDKARLVSDPEFQLIWGRILAEECNIPGFVPKGLLHTLEKMDRNDAEQFTMLCSFSVYVVDNGVRNYSPIIIKKYLSGFDSYYQSHGIGFDDLVNLKALGLIEMSVDYFSPGDYRAKFNASPIDVRYHDKHYCLPEDCEVLPVGNVILTKTGQALCRAIEVDEQEGFFEQYCIPYWKQIIGK